MTEGGASPDQGDEPPKEPAEPRWPTLPADCPTNGAAPKAGTFYRFAKGSDDDWRLPIQILGEEECLRASAKNGLPICRWHALSVYADPAEMPKKRKRFKKMFAGSHVLRVTVTHEMGVLLQDEPPSSHHDWWPSETFIPPPPSEVVPE